MELYTFYKIYLFMKNNYIPSAVIVWHVLAKMIVHAFMIELDQLAYPSKIKNFEII